MEKPSYKPNGKIIYFLNRDLKAILKRKERGLAKHYISNLIEMKKHSYFERELVTPLRTANKNTLTSYFKAYEELEVLEVFRTEKGIGLSVPYYFPANEKDWLVVGGGYFKLEVSEFKKAMDALSDNAFKVFLKMKMESKSIHQLTTRSLEKWFNWSVKTMKSILKMLKNYLNESTKSTEKVEEEVKELNLMARFNEAMDELKRKKRKVKSTINPHGIEDLKLGPFEKLIEKGQVLRKEVQIGLSRFGEYLNSPKRVEQIHNPGGYIYHILKKNGRYIPPESWILSQNMHEKGGKMVQIDSIFEQKEREIEEEFNLKKKKELLRFKKLCLEYDKKLERFFLKKSH
jgi:hypothetical protein